MDYMHLRKGDVIYVAFSPAIGSEQAGTLKAVVIQNDVGNKNSPTVIVAAITSVLKRKNLPTHVFLFATKYKFIDRDSTLMLEQVRTIDRVRFSGNVIGRLGEDDMVELDRALISSIGLAHSLIHNQQVLS